MTLLLVVLRIIYYADSFGAVNYTWASLNTALVTGLYTSISIVAATLPFSKIFINSLVLEWTPRWASLRLALQYHFRRWQYAF